MGPFKVLKLNQFPTRMEIGGGDQLAQTRNATSNDRGANGQGLYGGSTHGKNQVVLR